MSLVQLSGELKSLAQSMSPFDSGNLINSWRNQTRTNEIIIEVDLNQAPYVVFLEDGTKFSTKHQDFISVDIKTAIVEFVQNRYSNTGSWKGYNKQALAQKTLSTPARNAQFLKSLGGK